jgi:ribosomal protein S13
MAQSKRFADVVALGKRLVHQLGKDNDDLLSAWMAHHIAELIGAAEAARGKDAERLRKECAVVIMNLWEHRGIALRQYRPFADFDAVMDTIERLGPHRSESFYWERALRKQYRMKDEMGQQWLDAARSIDSTASQLVRWCVAQAVKRADPNNREWLDLIEEAGIAGEQAEAIRVVLQMMPDSRAGELKSKELQNLKAMRDKLLAIEVFSKKVALELGVQIEGRTELALTKPSGRGSAKKSPSKS